MAPAGHCLKQQLSHCGTAVLGQATSCSSRSDPSCSQHTLPFRPFFLVLASLRACLSICLLGSGSPCILSCSLQPLSDRPASARQDPR